MGLDMYLYKKTYLKNWNHDKENNYVVNARNNSKLIKHIKKERVAYVVEEVGYWRKVNHIHNWFVQNCQNGVDDCRASYVSRDQLEELRQLCKQVMDYLDTCDKIGLKQEEDFFTKEPYQYWEYAVDKSVMESTLPTASGFFFGGTEYNRWYYEGLQETIDIINETLEGIPEKEWGIEFEYHSSW